MKLSIVIPVFNSDETLARLVGRVRDSLTYVDSFEIVLVNDGSTNPVTDGICRCLAETFDFVGYLCLARNFGEHNAVMAGLRACRGDHAVIIDDDFQNPPEEIRTLYEKAVAGGHDVVYSYYAQKQHSFLRNLGSEFNDWVACLLLRKPPDLYLSSFKVINRFLIDQIAHYTGPYPYIDGLILRATDHIGTALVRHDARREGRSNYNLRRLFSLWLNMFTNFSVRPLRVASVVGLLSALAGFVMAIAFMIERLRDPGIPAGWASLIIVVLVMSGVQLFAIGVAGEYIGRLYLKSNAEPQFVVRRRHGWAAAEGRP